MSFLSQTIFDEKNKIWSGPDSPPVYNRDISVGQAVLHSLNLFSNKILQISDTTGQKLTGKELKTLSIRAALNFQQLGYDEDDMIGLVVANTHYLAPLVFGAFLNGTPINTLDPTFDKGGVKHMFGITKPKVVFCDSHVYEVVKQALEELSNKSPIYLMKGCINGVPTVQEFFKKTGKEENFIPKKFKNGGDHIAAVLCSSGTTGLPKGVCITHQALLTQIRTEFSNEEVYLCFSTLYWLSGVFFLLIGTLHGGTRIITDKSFSPELMLHLIEEYRVTRMLTPPSQMALVVQCPDIKKTDLSSIKSYMCGGSAVPVAIVKKMKEFLKDAEILVGYGMTELAGCVASENSNYHRSGSVGNVTYGIKLKILDDNGKQLGVNECGEICIKAPFKFLGYYGNEKATKTMIDNEGWIHSGDLGYMDEDGYLFIVDRKKEILKYRNYHYYPNEIEGVIMQIPDVVEVCVYGLPDVIATDLPAAVIVKKNESSLTEQDVYDYVAQNMAHFKHLRGGVQFAKSLPKTASGKIQRRIVKELFGKRQEVIEILDK